VVRETHLLVRRVVEEVEQVGDDALREVCVALPEHDEADGEGGAFAGHGAVGEQHGVEVVEEGLVACGREGEGAVRGAGEGERNGRGYAGSG